MSLQSNLRSVAPHQVDAQQESRAALWDCDPLAQDESGDVAYLTTARRLLRLAICAADVGARFAREGRSEDPAAWMLSPRRLFADRVPIEACQDLENFRRSVILNGLQMGLDADPRDIDDLLTGDGDADVSAQVNGIGSGREPEGEGIIAESELYTCWVDVEDGCGRVLAFMAIVTDRPTDLVERVIGRYGVEAARNARFRQGFDHTAPLATAMLSDAMTDMLREVAAAPTSPLAEGVDVTVEQRFQS